ncbi:hypothetical protein CR513_26126, partial [Mucuna pruriens]
MDLKCLWDIVHDGESTPHCSSLPYNSFHFARQIWMISAKESHPGQTDSFPDRPTLQSNSPIRSGSMHYPCKAAQLTCQHNFEPAQLPCHSREACSASFTMSETKLVQLYFAKAEKLLGFIVNEREIELDLNKVKAFQNIPPPRTETEVRSFLGRVNYIARFISQLMATCNPIFKLLQKNQKMEWN